MSKVLAIGDIHTKTWIVNKVSKIIDRYERIVFCGDYADDFSASPQDSIDTWKALKDLQLKYEYKVSLVLGNHDYIYVNNTPSMQSGYNPMTHVLIDAPENNDLKKWLTGLPIIIEIDGVTYSHAGISNEWSGTEDVTGLWNDTSPIWARPSGNITYKNIPQVFGHTPSDTCYEVKHGVWCIDTFSTEPDGKPFGDESVLQVIDGRKFFKLYLE